MKAALLIAGSSLETGALLREYLTDRGVKVDNDAKRAICYGAPTSRRPALNARCGLDKIERMEIMTESGVRCVPWFKAEGYVTEPPKDFRFPALARKAFGCGGTDIVPVFEPEEVPLRIAAGWDWFSSYVPIDTELRVWIYRGEHLDTYEKTLMRPSDYKYIGRNFRNGFDFVHSDELRCATVLAGDAVEELGLDFGAVDLLIGKDSRCYILEVNTAPGVLKSGAQKTLGKLADHMVEWIKNA